MQALSPLDSAVISQGTEAKDDGADDGKPVDETGHTVIIICGHWEECIHLYNSINLYMLFTPLLHHVYVSYAQTVD